MKLLLILVGSQLLGLSVFSQMNINNDVTLYIHYTYPDDSLYNKKIAIDYDLFYPIYKPVTEWITLKRENAVIQTKVSSNSILLDGKSLLIENGDTVYIKVEGREAHPSFTDKNNQLLFFNSLRQSAFKNKIYPTNKLNDTDFSYGQYKKFSLDYFAEERKFIDSCFGYKRASIKQRLLNSSRNNELISLILPFLNGKLIEQNDKVELDSLTNLAQVKLYHFSKGYITDPSYRNVISQINLYKTNIKNVGILRPEEYDLLYYNALKSYSKDIYTYLLLNYLRNIARAGNNSYKEIANKIYRKLYSENLNTKLKTPIDSLYKNFQKLAVNINFFGDVEVKNFQNKKMRLKEIIEGDTPVLLDFWATWCAPCIEEIPHLDSVRQHFPEIKVISLSIDENESKWFKFINNDESVRESSYLLTVPAKSKIVQLYEIESVPRFFLYNKNGDCLSLDFVRPSDKTFTATVKRLLNNN